MTTENVVFQRTIELEPISCLFSFSHGLLLYSTSDEFVIWDVNLNVRSPFKHDHCSGGIASAAELLSSNIVINFMLTFSLSGCNWLP